MEKLTALDICKIIQSCHKHKVSRFQLQSLKLEFNPLPEIIEKEVLRDLHVEQPELPVREKLLKQKEQYEELLQEAKLADPLAYEQMMEKGEEMEQKIMEQYG